MGSTDHVGLRLQSASMTVADMELLAGRSSTSSSERDTPLSSRRPNGAVHEVSTVIFEQSENSATLDDFLEGIRPLLDRVATAGDEHHSIKADLVVAITARPLGYIVELCPRSIALLATSGCGVMVDAYSSESSGEAD